MKRIWVLLLVLSMTVVVAACGKPIDSGDVKDTGTETQTVFQTEAETNTPNTNMDPTLDYVDVERLKQIENQDSCDVKIIKKEVLEGAYPGNFSIVGNDAIVLHITNIGSKPVSDISVYILGYDSNNAAVYLKTDVKPTHFNGDSYIDGIVTNEDFTIQPGQTEKVSLRTDKSTFASVRCIVSSYTVNGETVENAIADTWYQEAIIGKSTVLD